MLKSFAIIETAFSPTASAVAYVFAETLDGTMDKSNAAKQINSCSCQKLEELKALVKTYQQSLSLRPHKH